MYMFGYPLETLTFNGGVLRVNVLDFEGRRNCLLDFKLDLSGRQRFSYAS